MTLLLDILTPEMIEINYECKTRDEAVSSAGRLLVKKGYAKESYINAMIKNIANNGTYIVIAPGIAMPHARPEDGVLAIGLSIAILKEPVVFGHPKNDPVKIVVGLCAVDHQSHLKALSELVDILGNEEKVKNIKDAKSSEEIIAIVKGGAKND
ncbi:PTS system IIA component, L-Asc family [Carnobacterium iners]|uniref:PTS system IIA component, L-Asc family n=1 Tax=Carnobacterium iners TaxID=1073423 RepID=A0A1X7MPI9_9LACT|nr:PTS sugar transporter subunit IIA [Carnobacterium iners]SEK94997.1 PTS system IIA component, L-Asc family [Carnobacterium iners]SMH26615.1 PTS system IIA component, L-Asc family [Carnobacterium iners]